MALRIRFQFDTGAALGYSVERLKDGLLFDFSTSSFVASPAHPIEDIHEDAAPFLGRYKATLDPTPSAQFADGDYAITIHRTSEADHVVAQLGVTMFQGDDGPVFPGHYNFAFSGTLGPTVAPGPTGVVPAAPAPKGS